MHVYIYTYIYYLFISVNPGVCRHDAHKRADCFGSYLCMHAFSSCPATLPYPAGQRARILRSFVGRISPYTSDLRPIHRNEETQP